MGGAGMSRLLLDGLQVILTKRPNNIKAALKLVLKVVPLVMLLRLLTWSGRLTTGHPSTLAITCRTKRTSTCTSLEQIPEHEELT